MRLQQLIQKHSCTSKYQLFQHTINGDTNGSKHLVRHLLLEIESAGALKEFQDYLIELHTPEYITEFYGKYFNEGA